MLIISAITLPDPFSKHYISRAEAPDRELKDYSAKELVNYYAIYYKQDPALLQKVAGCESNYNQKLKGDNGLATGIFQYHKGTWESFSKLLGEELDINSVNDQAKLTAFIFTNYPKLKIHWTTYTAIKNGGTYSFYSKLLKKSFVVKCR